MTARKGFRAAIMSILAILILAGCHPDAVDSAGRSISLSDYKGRWVVINYWTTWCAPCIAENPDLVKLAKYYSAQVVVLGVNLDHLDNRVLQDLRQKYRINYPLLGSFPIEKFGAAQPTSLPITFIFNPEGKLYTTLSGQQTLTNFQAVLSLPPITYN